MLGVVVAQLFRLTNPKPAIRGYLIGVPLASILIAAAILVLLLGAFRSWRQQNAMLRSKVHAGGWEIMVLMLTVFIVWPVSFATRIRCWCRQVSVILFALIFAIDSARDQWVKHLSHVGVSENVWGIAYSSSSWARIQWAIPFFIFGYMNEKHFPTRMLDQNSWRFYWILQIDLKLVANMYTCLRS